MACVANIVAESPEVEPRIRAVMEANGAVYMDTTYVPMYPPQLNFRLPDDCDVDVLNAALDRVGGLRRKIASL